MPTKKFQDVPYDRAVFPRQPLQLVLLVHEGLLLSRTCLDLTTLQPPFLQNPSNSNPNNWRGAWSYPPMSMARKKLLNSLPIVGHAATVNSTEFMKSSRNWRPSRGTSLFKKYLPTLLRATITRVPDKNSSLSIVGTLEWFDTTYSTYCSTRGNDERFFIFCRRQNMKRTCSPNAKYPQSFAVWGCTKLLATETKACITEIEPTSWPKRSDKNAQVSVKTKRGANLKQD